MATYNLNEELKAREKAKQGADSSQEMALDDVARVKVLSPGRKVFKRFIRNRLAVFGSVTLIVLFVFSFLGPLVYPYGQKQIFYTYDKQNVNYALAKENTTYNGYVVDEDVEIERTARTSMNSQIKKMIEADKEEQIVLTDDGSYLIRRETEHIYTLSGVELEEVATVGAAQVEIGTFSQIKKTIDYTGDEVEGLDEAAAASIKGAEGTFTYDGVEYTFTRGAAKSYTITASSDGVNYTGEDLGDDFAEAAEQAAESGEAFEVDGESYLMDGSDGNYTVYKAGEAETGMVYTTYTVDTYETGIEVSDEFKAGVMMAAAAASRGEEAEFTADDQGYSVSDEDGTYVIYTADGEEYGELGTFTVRRYTGEDTMEYDLKKAIAAKVAEMVENGEKSGTLTHGLPAQGESGEYVYDDDGNLVYSETEMKITQRDTGEFVINCDQVNYIIDRFASPSLTHILGTDGDGFDVMSRIMYGGRISLMVGFIVVFIETFLGVVMGGLAGYYGGWVDNLIMRLVDIFYCLPSLPIMIILGAMMDAMRMDTYVRLCIMMAALGIMGWAGVARLVRGQILSLREQEFMVATEATGIRVKDRIFRHLIPNVMPQLIVTATMGIGSVILTESTLSFLGLGVKHPLATWGTIINSVSTASAMAHYAFIWIPVGLLICLTVIAFNFVGDGLRDAYDPRSKK